MSKTTILKIDFSPWKNESRDMRELSLYEELGAEVVVLAKGDENDRGRIDLVNGIRVYRYTTRPLGQRIPRAINRVASLFAWARFVRKELKPDIISGHDLPGVIVAWIANLFLPQERRANIIYDSHEFELGRNEKRNRLTSLAIQFIESFLIRRCVFTIAVNDSIADKLVEVYKLENRPVVVRSTPKKWDLNEERIANNRRFYSNKLGVEFLVTYHGIIRTGRGIEEIIRLLSKDKTMGAIIVGDSSSEEYYKRLQQMAEDIGVRDRIEFHKAVPLESLSELIGAGDVSMVLIKPESQSYYLSLPNKFFESVQALAPMIASDLPEMARLMKEYEIGLLCNPDDLDDVYSKVCAFKNDRKYYELTKNNLCIAKESLCWEIEKNRLKDAILPLLEVCK